MKESLGRKKANSGLQHLRTDFLCMIGKERLNALSLNSFLLIEICFLIITKIINIYASKYSTRMHHTESAKFRGSRAIVGLMGLVP